jgi:hypothetical protein
MLRDPHAQRTGRLPSRWPSVWRGLALGLVVGVAWTAVIGPLTDGPPSVWLSLAVYATGLAITGAVVGAVRRFPEVVGLSTGFLTLAVLAGIVAPGGGWGLLWLVVFGGSGLLCGPVIGLCHRLLTPAENGEPDVAADRPRE